MQTSYRYHFSVSPAHDSDQQASTTAAIGSKSIGVEALAPEVRGETRPLGF